MGRDIECRQGTKFYIKRNKIVTLLHVWPGLGRRQDAQNPWTCLGCRAPDHFVRDLQVIGRVARRQADQPAAEKRFVKMYNATSSLEQN
jgi:hypothetical protein